MNSGLVTTQTQNVGQKSARFASANDFTSSAWRQMGTESSCCCIILCFAASLSPGCFFLTIRLRVNAGRAIQRPAERCLVPHTAQGGDISCLFFVKAMPFPQNSTYRTRRYDSEWIQMSFFSFHLSATVVFHENKLLHMSTRRNKGVIWAVGQEHGTLSITVCTGPLLWPLRTAPVCLSVQLCVTLHNVGLKVFVPDAQTHAAVKPLAWCCAQVYTRGWIRKRLRDIKYLRLQEKRLRKGSGSSAILTCAFTSSMCS